MELLDERWTLLVVRELLSGSWHFNDLRRGVPQMSPTLLSQAAAAADPGRASSERRETTAGRLPADPRGRRSCAPSSRRSAAWGVRWIGELGDADLDPKLLLWDMHRNVDHEALPRRRTVVASSSPTRRPARGDWWLVLGRGDVDVCDDDPGHPVDRPLTADLRRMVAVWMGDVPWGAAVRSGDMVLEGPAELRRALPGWFTLSTFAAVPRPRAVAAAVP